MTELFKFVVAADFHFNNFIKLTPTDSTLLSQRCRDIGRAYDEIEIYCKDNNIEHLIIAGDIFHQPNTIEVSVFNYVSKMLKYRPAIKKYLLVGNHDQATRNGKVHSLMSLHSESVEVIDVATSIPVHGVDLFFFPYASTDKFKESIKETLIDRNSIGKPCIAFGHIGLEGALLGGLDIRSKEPVAVEDLCPAYFDAIYLGHYHRHQKVDHNIWYVGAPLQHNMGDEGQERGFIECTVLKDKDETFVQTKFIPLKEYPEFHSIEAKDYESGMFPKQDFVKLLNATKADMFKFIEDTQIKIISKQILNEGNVRISMSMNDSFDTLIKKFVNYIKPELSLKQKRRYIELGKDLLPCE